MLSAEDLERFPHLSLSLLTFSVLSARVNDAAPLCSKVISLAAIPFRDPIRIGSGDNCRWQEEEIRSD
jgi:hypothetical protein